MNCIVCGTEISALRLHVLPFTEKCVRCSDEKMYTEKTCSSAYSLVPSFDGIETDGEMTEVRDDALTDAQRAGMAPGRIIEELRPSVTPTDVFAKL